MSKIKEEILKVFRSSDKNAVLTILWTTLILGLYFYFGIHQFWEGVIGGAVSDASALLYWKYILHNFSAFFFFFLLTLPFVKFVLKKNISEMGFKVEKPEVKFTKITVLLGILIAPLLSLSSALTDAGLQALYPLSGRYMLESGALIALYFLSYFAYYIGWEYLFRGVLFKAVSEKYGGMLAIAVTTMISALIHSSIAGFGKPFTETFAAIFGGVLFGYLAYKSKSIYPSLAAHIALGFSQDIFIMTLVW